MNINESVKFRILDTIATISSYSPEVFKLCESNGFLNDIVNELDTQDVLIKLNVIELLDKVLFFEERFVDYCEAFCFQRRR